MNPAVATRIATPIVRTLLSGWLYNFGARPKRRYLIPFDPAGLRREAIRASPVRLPEGKLLINHTYIPFRRRRRNPANKPPKTIHAPAIIHGWIGEGAFPTINVPTVTAVGVQG